MARVTPDVPQRGAAQNLLNVVDNYYAPARDRVGEQGMSQGLEAASNFFGQQAAIEKEHQLKEISLQAQQDAMQGLDPDEELAQVRKGLLFRSNSRAYNQVYNETMGKKAAIEFKENATLDYEKSGLSKSTDPAAFREWMNNRTNEFLTAESSQNPYFLAGAMPYVEQTAFNMGAKHMSNINSTLKANHAAAVKKQMDDITLSVMTDSSLSNEERLATVLGVGDKEFDIGVLEGRTIKGQQINSLIAGADATNDVSFLDYMLEQRDAGVLRFSPSEWNTLEDARNGILKEIDWKTGRELKLQEAVLKQDTIELTDLTADLVLANPDITQEQVLDMPYKQGSDQTVREWIASRPNSRNLAEGFNDAFKTIATLNDIGPQERARNDAMIIYGLQTGLITNSTELNSFIDDNGINMGGENWATAYQELGKILDPESITNTQIFKDINHRNIKALPQLLGGDDEELSYDPSGNVVGAQAQEVLAKYQGYVRDYTKGLVSTDSDAIEAALAKAREATFDFYRTNELEYYNSSLASWNDAVAEGKMSESSSPYFAGEADRLRREQAAIDTRINIDLAFETDRLGRVDLETQAKVSAAEADLLGEGGISTAVNMAKPEVKPESEPYVRPTRSEVAGTVNYTALPEDNTGIDPTLPSTGNVSGETLTTAERSEAEAILSEVEIANEIVKDDEEVRKNRENLRRTESPEQGSMRLGASNLVVPEIPYNETFNTDEKREDYWEVVDLARTTDPEVADVALQLMEQKLGITLPRNMLDLRGFTKDFMALRLGLEPEEKQAIMEAAIRNLRNK